MNAGGQRNEMGTKYDDYVKLDLKKSEKGEDERKAIATRTMHKYMERGSFGHDVTTRKTI